MLLAALIVPACGDDEEPTPSNCNTEDITYDNFVGDVLRNSCTFSGCHSAGNMAVGDLTTYDGASNFMFEDKMITSLRRTGESLPMPRDTATGNAGTPLPDCTIDKIEAWLDAGKPQ